MRKIFNIFVYDIEIFSNFFCVTFLDYKSNNKEIFEISERRNDYIDLIQYLDRLNQTARVNSVYGISFNGIDYDNLILNFLGLNYIRNFNFEYQDYLYICSKTKEFSDYIINNKNNEDYFEQIKFYKWKHSWIDIDLLCYWSLNLRKTKQLSLKSLGIQLNYPVVMELPIHHKNLVKREDIPKIIEYNSIHDVTITKLVADKKKNDILFRKDVFETYKTSKRVFSWDSPKIGSKLIELDLVSKGVKLRDDEGKIINTNRHQICIGDLLNYDEFKTFKGEVIPPKVEIKVVKEESGKKRKKIETYSNIISLYEGLKAKCVKNTNEINAIVPLYNPDNTILKCVIGSGGLHADLDEQNQIHFSDEFTILDIDFSSYYPNLICNNKFVPEHLGEVFLSLYSNILIERITAKKAGNVSIAEIKKLILNSAYGLMNNDYSFLKDRKQTLSICYNGQLILLYLVEQLIDQGCIIIMCNTDGFTIKVKKERKEEIINFINSINTFNIELEFVEYEYMILKNVNNYIAKDVKGKIKKKGKLFRTEVPLGDSVDFLIIPKLLELYFDKGLNPLDVINKWEIYNFSIYDFCASVKINKNYKVFYNNNRVQQLNRFYVSKKGSYLYKQKNTKTTLDNVVKGYGVILFNDYQKLKPDEYNIDYSFYLNKVNSIIWEIEKYSKQLTLF